MANDDEPQQLPFLIPPPPEEVIRNSSGQSSANTQTGGTESVQETPERIAARQEIDNLNASHAEVMQRQLAHDEATADIDKRFKDAQLQQFEATQAARDKALKATQPGIDEWKNRLAESMKKFDAAPAPKLFADKTTPEKIRGALGLVLAGIGDAMGKAAAVRVGQSTAGWDSVSKIIDMDLTRQRENIKKLDDNVVMARTGVKNAQDARDLLLAQVDQRGAVAFKRVELMAQARLAAQGKDAAGIKTSLDELGWQEKGNERKLASVSPLINHVTQGFSNTNGLTSGYEHTQNKNKPQPAGSIPTHMVDPLTGSDIPIDPTATTGRQHATAAGKLAATDVFIGTADKLLGEAEGTGQARNSTIAAWTNGNTTQAEREGTMKRLRSSYAASKGESVGAHNAKELEAALPDPPSSLAPKGAWDAWRAQIRAVTDEQKNSRASLQANAGVRLSDIARTRPPTPGELPAAPAKKSTPEAPATPAPRDRVIQLLKANPNRPNAPAMRKMYGISDKDLQ